MENDSSYEKKEDFTFLKYIWIFYLALGLYSFFINEDSLFLIAPLGFLFGIYTVNKTRKNIKYKFIYKTVGIIGITVFVLFALYIWALANAGLSNT